AAAAGWLCKAGRGPQRGWEGAGLLLPFAYFISSGRHLLAMSVRPSGFAAPAIRPNAPSDASNGGFQVESVEIGS
ncbi:MAG: hypothetical protein WA112_07190, partial [Rugosibacter sp.]